MLRCGTFLPRTRYFTYRNRSLRRANITRCIHVLRCDILLTVPALFADPYCWLYPPASLQYFTYRTRCLRLTHVTSCIHVFRSEILLTVPALFPEPAELIILAVPTCTAAALTIAALFAEPILLSVPTCFRFTRVPALIEEPIFQPVSEFIINLLLPNLS